MMPLADNGGAAAEGSSEQDEAAMAARAQEQRVVRGAGSAGAHISGACAPAARCCSLLPLSSPSSLVLCWKGCRAPLSHPALHHLPTPATLCPLLLLCAQSLAMLEKLGRALQEAKFYRALRCLLLLPLLAAGPQAPARRRELRPAAARHACPAAACEGDHGALSTSLAHPHPPPPCCAPALPPPQLLGHRGARDEREMGRQGGGGGVLFGARNERRRQR